MEFSISNSDFAPALQKCSRALETKATIPMLSTFLLNADSGTLSVSATDLAVAVTSSVKCAIGSEGKVCLPGEKLLGIVRALRGEESSVVTIAKGAATIKSGKSRFKIAGFDAAQFPAVPEAPETLAIFDAPIFRRSIERVKFAISKQDSRFVLLAMLLECDDTSLIFAGTDGHRMALVKHARGDSKRFKVLLSLAGIQALPYVLTSMDNIEMSMDDNHIWLTQGYDTLCMRRVAGSFPAYGDVFDRATAPLKLTASLNVGEFKEGIDRALICTVKGKDSIPSVDLNFVSGELSLFCTDAVNSNEALESVPMKYDGEAVGVRMNGEYLTECLNAIGTSEVQLKFKDGKSACEVRSIPEDGYRYLVMPLHK